MNYTKKILSIIIFIGICIFIYPGVQDSYSGEDEVNKFVDYIMPNLLKFAKDEKIQFLEGENKEDFLTTVYNFATWRGKLGYGTWSEEDDFMNELKFAAGFWCALPWWPKIDNTKSNLIKIRKQYIKNAYNRAIVSFALENTTVFTYSKDQIKSLVQEKIKPRNIMEVLNMDLILDKLGK